MSRIGSDFQKNIDLYNFGSGTTKGRTLIMIPIIPFSLRPFFYFCRCDQVVKDTILLLQNYKTESLTYYYALTILLIANIVTEKKKSFRMYFRAMPITTTPW